MTPPVPPPPALIARFNPSNTNPPITAPTASQPNSPSSTDGATMRRSGAADPRPITLTGSVDTHLDFHVAAAAESNGGVLGVEPFDTTTYAGECRASTGSGAEQPVFRPHAHVTVHAVRATRCRRATVACMLGELIAVGRTSEVYAVGLQRAAKVLNADVPAQVADAEAAFTTAVRLLGVRVPEVHDVTNIGGRTAIVFERISGRSMWGEMLASPTRLDELVHEFVELQRAIHRAGVPVGMPSSSSRMRAKICGVKSLSTADRTEACNMVSALPSGAALLHGDLHPGNVLMSADGPVAIDWFDATIGHPITDVVRTALLLRPAGAGPRHHLRGADHSHLQSLHDRYVAAVSDMLVAERDRIGDWESVAVASRLAEGTDPDLQDLTNRWVARRSTGPAWSLQRALASASG